MIVTFSRTGGRGQPPESEFLEIDDDGSLAIRRSSGTSRVGRFGGHLAGAELTRMEALAAAAEATGSIDAIQLPDSSLVTVNIGDAIARFGDGDPPSGAWSSLTEALGSLLDGRLDEPIAAIELVVGDHGHAARLEHQGTEALVVDLSDLTVRAVLWKGYYDLEGEWQSGAGRRAEPTRVERGWSIDLPFDHGFELGVGRTLHASAAFGLVEDDRRQPVLAAVSPPIEPPG
jgi:hypothetical protein